MPGSIDLEQTLEQAICHQTAGSLAEARTLCEQILEAEPDNVDALNLLGVVLQDLGNHEDARKPLERALILEPDFAEALANQARGLNILGRPDDAHKAASRAVEFAPDLGEAWQQLGVSYLCQNDAERALEAFRRAEKLLPESVQVYEGLGEAAKRLLDYATVVEALSVVLTARPDSLDVLVNLSVALTSLDRVDEAVALLRHALEIDPEHYPALVALAATMHKQRADPVALEVLCHRLLAAHPDSVDVLVLLGGAQAWLGRFDEAKVSYAKVLSLRPDHTDANWLLTSVGFDTGVEVDEATLRARLEDPTLPPITRASAGFTLAKQLERSGAYDDAFDAYSRANVVNVDVLRGNNVTFDRLELERYISWAINGFTRDAFGSFRPPGNPSELPVFIVGMPRSGTSLVEQIAASHPRVFGSGETKEIDAIMRRLATGTAPPAPAQWDKSLIGLELAQHITMLRKRGGGADRVIDKMPDNIFFLGQIALMFPNARVIICQRDLRDVCFSCFTNHFTDTLPWTSDLEVCAFRAVETQRLLQHWRQHVPLRMLEVSYEALVGDLEGQSRRLIDFLDLEWDPVCLEFNKNKRPVTTASYWQVRQPLYGSSVGRWRNFRSHLGPMLKVLSGYVPAEAVA